MTLEQHRKALTHMFHAAPVNLFFSGIQLSWENDIAIIELLAKDFFFHAGGSMHGAMYMKMLDDAAYFTAALALQPYFILTADFNLRFNRPVTGGLLTAKGRFLRTEGRYTHASADLYTQDGNLAATGTGRFAPGKLMWEDVPEYRLGLSNKLQ